MNSRLVIIGASVLLAACGQLRNEDVQREIASMEQVSLAQVEVINVGIGDGWSDGVEAEVRYRICRDDKRDSCTEKSMDASFERSDSDGWRMIFPKRVEPGIPQPYRNDPCLSEKGKFVGWRNCIKLRPPERLHGVWYSSFAEDFFVEGASTAPIEVGTDPPEFTTGLDIDRKGALRRAGRRHGAWCIRAFAVEFIGRRPDEDISGYDLRPEKLIIVDNLTSVKFLHNVKLRDLPIEEQDCVRTPNPRAGLG